MTSILASFYFRVVLSINKRKGKTPKFCFSPLLYWSGLKLYISMFLAMENVLLLKLQVDIFGDGINIRWMEATVYT